MEPRVESLLVHVLAIIVRIVLPITIKAWVIARLFRDEGLTKGMSLGFPEYVALITLCMGWLIGANWSQIKCCFSPSARKAKRFKELEETINLGFDSLDKIFGGLTMAPPLAVPKVVHAPTAKPLKQRLNLCRVELGKIGIDSPEIPERIVDTQTWLEFLRQLKVFVKSGDYGRAVVWGKEVTSND